MAIKLAPKSEIKTKVVAHILGDMGKTEKFDFVIAFKKHSASAVRGFAEQFKDESLTELEVVKESVLNWEGVLTEGGEELPFNRDNLDLLLDWVDVRKAVVESFWGVQSGKVTAKN